jgi:hypothetical protein
MDSVFRTLSLPNAYETIYCTTKNHCIECCLLLKSKKVWGFDCEWRVSYEKGVSYPVALIQFACADICVLIHTHAIGELVQELNDVLSDPHIYLVGVNINGDITRLRRSFSNMASDIGGVCDLRNLYKGLLKSKSPTSLAALVGGMLNAELPKPHDTRCSNWETVPLSPSQTLYAALDAYAGYLLFEAIVAASPSVHAHTSLAFMEPFCSCPVKALRATLHSDDGKPAATASSTATFTVDGKAMPTAVAAPPPSPAAGTSSRASPRHPPATMQRQAWPAMTSKGQECKMCLKKSRGQFCGHHQDKSPAESSLAASAAEPCPEANVDAALLESCVRPAAGNPMALASGVVLRAWPALTAKNTPCKLCEKKGRDMFCRHHQE